MSPQEVELVLRLKRVKPDVTLAEIAAAIDRPISTVHYWLSAFQDTTEDARKVLQADSLDAALTIGDLMRHSEHGKIRLDAAKANLQANKLLGNEEQSIKVGVQVVIGVPSQGNHNLRYQTQTDSEGHTGQQVTDTPISINEAKVVGESE